MEMMSRPGPTPKIRQLALRLLSYEASIPSEPPIPAALRVSEKLRRPLSILMGSSGFRSLLARSLTLAKAVVPGLASVQVDPDGSLQGWSDIDNEDQADVMVIAQLLGLLVTFIGGGLVRGLVLDAWPDFTLENDLEKRDDAPTR
jgi:hypothetical protein